MDFLNRVALATGGTGALGSVVALDLLKSGARVAVTYASEAECRAPWILRPTGVPDADFSKWVKTEKVASVIHQLLLQGAASPDSFVVPVLE